jgi:hypothetical protein
MPIGVELLNINKEFDFLKEPFSQISKTRHIIKHKPKTILITQYYVVNTSDEIYNIARQKEIDKCLVYNLENKFIDELHLLTEEKCFSKLP